MSDLEVEPRGWELYGDIVLPPDPSVIIMDETPTFRVDVTEPGMAPDPYTGQFENIPVPEAPPSTPGETNVWPWLIGLGLVALLLAGDKKKR